MGCVFGKEVSSSGQPSGEVVVVKERRDKGVVGSVRKSEEEVAAACHGGGRRLNEENVVEVHKGDRRRLRGAGKTQADSVRKTRTRDRVMRGVPAPEANIDKRRLINHANAESKSEKFPPPHQDGGLCYPLGSPSHLIDPTLDHPDAPFSSVNFSYPKDLMQTWSGPLVEPGGGGGGGTTRRKLKALKKKGHWKDAM